MFIQAIKNRVNHWLDQPIESKLLRKWAKAIEEEQPTIPGETLFSCGELTFSAVSLISVVINLYFWWHDGSWVGLSSELFIMPIGLMTMGIGKRLFSQK